MKLHSAHAAQAPALRELQGILAKANKRVRAERALLFIERYIVNIYTLLLGYSLEMVNVRGLEVNNKYLPKVLRSPNK